MSAELRHVTGGDELLAGFADPVHGSQRAFRALMEALSAPGHVVELGAGLPVPEGVSPAAVAVLLTLADFETPLWLAPELAAGRIAAHVRFHTGAPVATDPATAVLALTSAAGAARLLGQLDTGTDQYPDRSATVVVEVPSLTGGTAVTLAGPGIETSIEIAPAELDHTFWMAVAANHALYPRGLDIYLTSGTSVIGLPRSTRATAHAAKGG